MTYPSLTIRKAARADVPAIARLLADDPLGSQREVAGEAMPASYLDAFEAIQRDPNQYLMVAELDGQVLGTFQMTFLRYLTYQGGLRAQIEAVRVADGWRSQGIGRQMMEWAIDEARRAGCVLVQLSTHSSRVDAHRFYERLGFAASHVGMKRMLG